MRHFIGIDLGTTGLKVALLAENGALVGSEYHPYPLLSPQYGYAEQDPQEWWSGVIQGCQNLKRKYPAPFEEVVGVGICGQMHTQVYLDRENCSLRPAITWMDQRSSEIVERINADPQARELIFRETRNFATTTYTAPQARWVKEHEPEVWERTARILVAKDYIKFLLTGEAATDYSEATGTLLFDVEKRRWSEQAFELFGIPRRLFPEARPSDEIIGRVSQQAARLTGIRAGTPVANGSSDNSAAALGAGMLHPGQATLIIGTAGVISVCSDQPLVDARNQTLCWHYCLRDAWITLGIMQTAGESLEWFKNAFDPSASSRQAGDLFEQYNQAAASVPEGCAGLIFLPYLNGERTPYWDPNARGVFYGLQLNTAKPHFIRAIMEGVSFGMRNNIETVERLGIKIHEVRAVGGGLRSATWLEILGKILKIPIVTVEGRDPANLGNILLCGKALGIYPSLEEAVAGMVATGRRVDYGSGSPVYEAQYPIFLELYEQLKGSFQQSAAARRIKR